MNEAFNSVSKEAFYIESHVEDILDPKVYIKLISFLAGGIENIEVGKVLEQQLLSYNSEIDETQDFLKTYVPLALISVVLSKPRQENSLTIAFNEPILESAFKKILNTDLKTKLSEKNVTLKDYSLMNYISSNGYISDIKVLYDILNNISKEVSEDLSDEIEKFYGGYIRNAVEFILQVYTDIFSSGYEVIQPYGVLTSFGAYKLDDNNKMVLEPGLELNSIYSVLSSYIKYDIQDFREFDTSVIDSVSLDGEGSIPYYPRKMLEYAFGRDNISNSPSSDIFPVDKNSVTWDTYKNKSISYGLNKAILKMTEDVLARHNMLGGKDENNLPKYMCAEAVEYVRRLCERTKIALTGCILISEWKKVDNKVIGFKVRIVDVRGTVPLDTNIVDKVIDLAFSGNKPEGTVIAVPTKRGKYVKEFGVQFDAQLCEAEPLFAFKALDSMKRKGITPSWDNLILGKYEDDTILSASSPRLNLKENLCHFIEAGSRSGKGVMTLNILASGIASGRPLFYLDRKPDMASLLKKLSRGRMFVFNGSDYQAKYDPDGLFTDEALAGWDKNISDDILKLYNGKRDSYKSMGDIFYLRALFFVIAILDMRCASIGNQEVYNKLGGDNGIILVVDELSNTLKGLDNFISETGRFFTNCIGETELRRRAEKIQKTLEKNPQSSERIPDIEVYSTAFVRCLDTSLTNIISRMGAGWQGNVNIHNDIFILGQYIKDYKGHENYSYQWTKTAGVASGQDSYLLQNMFLGMSADAFFGYNAKRSDYLNASTQGSKASTKLTSSARNFAYIPSLTFPVLDKVINGDKITGENAIYFKPCLILNESAEDSVPVQEFKNFCSTNKISYEDVKKMNSDANGNLDPRVGFADYVRSQSPNVDIAQVLGQSYEIGNYVVQRMGYQGDCIEFIYDLSPEWMMTVEEMCDKFMGKNVVPHAYSIIKEYAPHLLGGEDLTNSMSEDELNEYEQSIAETNDLLHAKAPEFSDNESIQVDNSEVDEDDTSDVVSPIQQPIINDDPLSVGGGVFDNEAFSSGASVVSDDSDIEDDSYNYDDADYGDVEDEQEFIQSDNLLNSEVEIPTRSTFNDDFKEQEVSDAEIQGEASPDLDNTNDDKVYELKKEIEFLKQSLRDLQNKEMQRRIVEATDKIMKEETPQERVLSEPYKCRCFGETINLQKYNGNLDITPNINITDDEMSVRDALSYVTDCILTDISQMFGGLDRITDIKVMSDVLVFNNICYAPRLSKEVISKLPIDIQYSVANGRLAWVFLFSSMRKMSNLTTLMFDDADFVYKKVRVDLGFNQDFNAKDLFKAIKSLMYVQIGDCLVERYGNDTTEQDFEDARRSTQMYDAVSSWGINTMRSNWQSAKDIYYNPEKRGFWKALGVTAHVGASAGAGLTSVGAKATKGLGILGRRMLKGAKAVRQAMKDSKE